MMVAKPSPKPRRPRARYSVRTSDSIGISQLCARPEDRARCSTWATCLGKAGRLQIEPDREKLIGERAKVKARIGARVHRIVQAAAEPKFCGPSFASAS